MSMTQPRSLFLAPQSGKIYMNGNALIKFGANVIRKARSKWFSNGFISGLSKSEFIKKSLTFYGGKTFAAFQSCPESE